MLLQSKNTELGLDICTTHKVTFGLRINILENRAKSHQEPKEMSEQKK